jgi:hypothetical protein
MMIRSIYTKVCWKPELPAGDSPGKLRLLVGQRNSLEFMAAPNEPFIGTLVVKARAGAGEVQHRGKNHS